MKSAIVASMAVALLPSFTAAKAYTFHVRCDRIPSLDGKPIVAWNGQFILGGNEGNTTTATCPDYDPNCPGKSTTIFSGPELGGPLTQIWMGVLQEHGQRVYVHDMPRDSEYYGYHRLVSYTAAGTTEDANVPKVSDYNDQFEIINYPDTDISYGALPGDVVLNPAGDTLGIFSLCSVPDGKGGSVDRVATGTKYCTPIAIGVTEVDTAAPQFYNCDGCEFRGDCSNYPSCSPPFCSDAKPKYN